MASAKLCGICVRKDVKMFENNQFQLMDYYKDVIGSDISRDCLPKWFCFECAALLHKFHLFKKKCYVGQGVFRRLQKKGSDNISKQTKISLGSNLQIMIASRNENVKTYSLKHSKLRKCKKPKHQFTKVFVDTIREADNSKVTEVPSVPIPNDINEEEIFYDFDNNDSNDMFIINKTDTKETTEKDFDNGNKPTKDADQVSDLDIQSANKDMSSNTRTISVIKSTNCIKKIDSVIKKAKKGFDNLMNIEDKDDAYVDKFQRSVKKKFLDSNHWTKITLTDEEASKRFQAKASEEKYLRADFKCADCYRTFSQEDMLKRHIKLRHCESLGPNECRHCKMRFKWKSRLQKHLKEHYTIFKCLRCELSFPVEISAFQHDYAHNGVIWTCAQCGQRFKHSSTYYTHLRKHKSKHVCTLCGISFVSEFGLFMHKRVKHVISEDSKDDNMKYCKVCDIKFDNAKGYAEHFAESALHATEVLEGATCLPLKTRSTKKRVPRLSTVCPPCGKSFSTYASFTKHHLYAHPETALPKSKKCKPDGRICEVCGATLSSSWALTKHLLTHSQDKRHVCGACGARFTTRGAMRRHQLTHIGAKNFVCDKCNKRFSHRSGLQMHLQMHEEELNSERIKIKKIEEQNEQMNKTIEQYKNYETLQNKYP